MARRESRNAAAVHSSSWARSRRRLRSAARRRRQNEGTWSMPMDAMQDTWFRDLPSRQEAIWLTIVHRCLEEKGAEWDSIIFAHGYLDRGGGARSCGLARSRGYKKAPPASQRLQYSKGQSTGSHRSQVRPAASCVCDAAHPQPVHGRSGGQDDGRQSANLWWYYIKRFVIIECWREETLDN
jgi:hypothetical protein